MGTIKADTVTGLADPNKLTVPTTVTVGATILTDGSAGSTTITAEGGSTTTNLQQGLVKAWCKFDGEAGSIANDDSFNVSGLTDHGTGQYTITIDNDMANDDYAHTCNGSEQVMSPLNSGNTFAGSVRIYSKNLSDSFIDAQEVSIQITGDLA